MCTGPFVGKGYRPLAGLELLVPDDNWTEPEFCTYFEPEHLNDGRLGK